MAEETPIPMVRKESLMIELYSSNEVGEKFLNRSLTDNEKMTLQSGNTLHWKNMDLGGDVKRDLNLKMASFINTNGEIEKGISVQLKAEKLDIPDKIMGKKLNSDEVATLKSGNFFCLEHNDKKFLIKIDPKIIAVTIRTPLELGIKEELGGYKFGKDELARLANNVQVGPKIYHSEKHGYFVSNLQIQQQGNSNEYVYSNIVNISMSEAKKLMPFLNTPKNSLDQTEVSKLLDIMGAKKNPAIEPSMIQSIKDGQKKPENKSLNFNVGKVSVPSNSLNAKIKSQDQPLGKTL